MKAPIYIRKDPTGTGAYLHDCYDSHLGYIHRLSDAEAIVAAVNGSAKIAAFALQWSPEPPYLVARVKGGHYAIEQWDGGVDLLGTFITSRGIKSIAEAKATAHADFASRQHTPT